MAHGSNRKRNSRDDANSRLDQSDGESTLTLYDNQTRSMLQTPQKYPRAGSQNYPSPAATAAEDGSTTIWFGPDQPDGVDRGNWIQTDPEKGWFTILRLYSPLPSFFDKSWRPSEIAMVN